MLVLSSTDSSRRPPIASSAGDMPRLFVDEPEAAEATETDGMGRSPGESALGRSPGESALRSRSRSRSGGPLCEAPAAEGCSQS